MRSQPSGSVPLSDSLGSSPSDDLLRKLADVGDREGAELQPGTTIGRFQIDGVLGKGGMGVVYVAHDPGLNRKVALKLLHRRFVARPDRRLRFLREAKAAAAVEHASVARILEVSDGPAGVYLVFEHVRGRTLRERVRGGPLPFEEVVRVGRAICEALAAAHAAGVVHRDLKPDNVMCTDGGEVKVLDFGLAKWTDNEATVESSEIITIEGEVLGSPGYMSPEQALGRETDARSDLFSLGVVLFELATGRRPFSGATKMETLVATSRDGAPDPRAHRSELPRRFSRLVRSCLEKDPGARPESAEAISAALLACHERPGATRGLLLLGGSIAAALVGYALFARAPDAASTRGGGEAPESIATSAPSAWTIDPTPTPAQSPISGSDAAPSQSTAPPPPSSTARAGPAAQREPRVRPEASPTGPGTGAPSALATATGAASALGPERSSWVDEPAFSERK